MAVNKVPSWSFPQNKWKKQPELEIENCVRLPTIGSGRSYGDSNFLGKLTSSKSKFKELFFDPNGNSVTLGGGVTIYEAVLFLSQYQRTLAVVPGTMEATIGGCIASNIHGKNSHKVGSFANTLLSFSIRTENGYSEITREKSEIWNLTIGGQGLTGEIISATLKTVPLLSTSLASKYIRVKNFAEIFSLMREYESTSDFLIGWIDGTTPGLKFRGYIEIAEDRIEEANKTIPNNFNFWKKNFPRIKLINFFTICIFNCLTHLRVSVKNGKWRTTSRWSYLFPMNSLGFWNYFFGNSGYHEVQFSCEDESLSSAINLLHKISNENSSFLIGIKIMNCEPEGYLCFPQQKWSIAINFSANRFSVSKVRKYYDAIIEFNGRVYLTKDWVLNQNQFEAMYPEHIKVKEWRKTQQNRVESNFSKRVGL